MPDPEFRAVQPHDHRYGRLFTDGDVGNLIAALLDLEWERWNAGREPLTVKEVDVDELDAHLTFPVGEPMYVLRAAAPRALEALEAYFDALAGAVLVDDTVTQEHVDDAGIAMDRFRAYVKLLNEGDGVL